MTEQERDYLKANAGKHLPRRLTWRQAATRVFRRRAFTIVCNLLHRIFSGWEVSVQCQMTDRDGQLLTAYITNQKQTEQPSVSAEDDDISIANPY